ncbi:MAG: immunoglobulin domain-containing protein [Verrucomicrobiales bacterium]|nr:immunoglobulin domain-containing protein [Verrucomicrobiales bacterium]
MNRFTQTFAIFLAAALQTMPLLRNIVTAPAASSTFAIILRWTIGSAATLGAVDAVSGATSAFTSPSTFNGATGTPFSNNVVVSIGGGNTAAADDYFILSSGSLTSPLLLNGQSTTVTMPPGLIFKASWVNGATTIGGVIFGTPTTTGSYPTTITVVSPGNASLSQKVTITISGTTTPTAPAITSQPSGTNIIAGKTATFIVAASGTAPLGYFWSKGGAPLANGGNISGANTTTLTVSSVSAADVGNYSVVVSNSVGTAASTSAALSVIVPPAITSQPAGQSLTAGSSAQFAVAASGSAPLNYRWLKGGIGLTNGVKFSGVNSNVLTIAGIATADEGNYSVNITNLAGSVTSSVAPLTVVSSPSIVTPPASQTVSAGASTSFTVSAAGSAPLVYRWLKNTLPLADGGNVSGSATATLTLSGVSTNDAASYSVTVSNSLGGITSPVATLTVMVPPAIITQPAGASVVAGTNVTFTVAASGSATLAFQWRKNGNALANGGNVSGANSATLSLTNVSATDAANYSVTVTNTVGSITSGNAALTVLGPPAITSQPANVTVAQGSSASFSVTVSGTAPLSFQWLKNGVAIPGANSNVLTFSAVTTNDTASYFVVVTNAVGNASSFSAALTVLVPPAIVAQPVDASVAAGTNVTFTVTASGSAMLTYQWRKNGGSLSNGGNVSGATSATLSLANVSATDAANYSVTVTNAVGSITSGSAALAVLAPPAIITQPTNQVAALGSTVTLAVEAAGTGPLSYQWFKGTNTLADGGNISGSTSNILTIATLATNDVDAYFVVISNFLGNATSTNASVAVTNAVNDGGDVAPIITSQPASQVAAQNKTVVLTVTATGTGPLAYQWSKNGKKISNGGNISGTTSSSLTLVNANVKNSGSYSVVVTNLHGKAASAAATLQVLVPPLITKSPVSRTVKAGAKVVFHVKAKGSKPLSYQWFKNGTALVDGGNIFGSTEKALKIFALTTADSATYSVVVSNLVGSATSDNALLTVLAPSDGNDGGDNVSSLALPASPATANAIVPVVPPVISQIIKNENGGITLNCAGTAGSVYVLQATSDFANWTGIYTNTADASGQWQATDKTDAACRFYRIKSEP